MASPFISAMDKETNHLQYGENGSAEYTVSDIEKSRVALFFALVRDIPVTRLQELLRMVMRDGKENENMIADLFNMIFQTRHCRGGGRKGSVLPHDPGVGHLLPQHHSFAYGHRTALWMLQGLVQNN